MTTRAEIEALDIQESEIDAGARALRERQMAGRITRPWEKLPNSAKRKWRDQAAVVLTTARCLRLSSMKDDANG